MVLSKLTLDLNDVQARHDLSDPYEMHATLMRFADAGASRPLWRLETPRSEAPFILIQTGTEPDPTQLRARGAKYFASFESRPHRLLGDIAVGDTLRFRIRANPTVTREGKRHGLLREEQQLAWIDRVLSARGTTDIFAVVSESTRQVMRRRRGRRPIIIHGVTFDGVLLVEDPQALRTAVREGIGHAKALGFGLLTVAR
jgi:CRISPR system Cascade subunit CasE